MEKKKYVAYVGTYTHGSSEGIHLFDLDVENGSMSNVMYLKNAESISHIVQNSGQVSIGFFVGALVVVAILAGIIGYLVGVGKLFGGLPASLTVALFNMDNYVIIGSLILLVFSIYLSTINENSTVAIVILNIFSSIVFSWLLTKKTSKKSWRCVRIDI